MSTTCSSHSHNMRPFEEMSDDDLEKRIPDFQSACKSIQNKEAEIYAPELRKMYLNRVEASSLNQEAHFRLLQHLNATADITYIRSIVNSFSMNFSSLPRKIFPNSLFGTVKHEKKKLSLKPLLFLKNTPEFEEMLSCIEHSTMPTALQTAFRKIEFALLDEQLPLYLSAALLEIFCVKENTKSRKHFSLKAEDSRLLAYTEYELSEWILQTSEIWPKIAEVLNRSDEDIVLSKRVILHLLNSDSTKCMLFLEDLRLSKESQLLIADQLLHHGRAENFEHFVKKFPVRKQQLLSYNSNKLKTPQIQALISHTPLENKDDAEAIYKLMTNSSLELLNAYSHKLQSSGYSRLDVEQSIVTNVPLVLQLRCRLDEPARKYEVSMFELCKTRYAEIETTANFSKIFVRAFQHEKPFLSVDDIHGLNMLSWSFEEPFTQVLALIADDPYHQSHGITAKPAQVLRKCMEEDGIHLSVHLDEIRRVCPEFMKKMRPATHEIFHEIVCTVLSAKMVDAFESHLQVQLDPILKIASQAASTIEELHTLCNDPTFKRAISHGISPPVESMLEMLAQPESTNARRI